MSLLLTNDVCISGSLKEVGFAFQVSLLTILPAWSFCLCFPFQKLENPFDQKNHNHNLLETEYRIRFIHCETNSVIRFLKKFANNHGFQNPFLKKEIKKIRKRITQSVSKKKKTPNGFHNPFFF